MRVHVVRATHNGRKNQITLFVKIKKKNLQSITLL